jgi:hypothetical protein
MSTTSAGEYARKRSLLSLRVQRLNALAWDWISLDSAQVINLAQTVERLLQDSKISPLDKLRLIVMYIGARAAQHSVAKADC